MMIWVSVIEHHMNEMRASNRLLHPMQHNRCNRFMGQSWDGELGGTVSRFENLPRVATKLGTRIART